MKYKTLDRLKVRTPQGELELQAGQIITLPQETAIRLLNEGRITPIGRVAYKVWSEPLNSFLWVCASDEDMQFLRSKNIKDAIYTNNEIKELKKLPKEGLKDIQRIKEIFENAKIMTVKGEADSPADGSNE
jgi:hypothetical protein